MKLYSCHTEIFGYFCWSRMSTNFQKELKVAVFILPFKWWLSHAKVVAGSDCVIVLKVACSQFAFIISFRFIGLAVMHGNATLESWVHVRLQNWRHHLKCTATEVFLHTYRGMIVSFWLVPYISLLSHHSDLPSFPWFILPSFHSTRFCVSLTFWLFSFPLMFLPPFLHWHTCAQICFLYWSPVFL